VGFEVGDGFFDIFPSGVLGEDCPNPDFKDFFRGSFSCGIFGQVEGNPIFDDGPPVLFTVEVKEYIVDIKKGRKTHAMSSIH